MKKTYIEYLTLVLQEPVNPTLRYGQVLFNLLHKYDANLANLIRGTEFDTFHETEANTKTAEFFIFIKGYYANA